VFIVAWQGTPPPDKADWIRILREALAGELGSYRIVFNRAKHGWRFTLDWREDQRGANEGLVANSPESVAYNLYASLAADGKPVDATWKPGAS
jgi:hypothetical protein